MQSCCWWRWLGPSILRRAASAFSCPLEHAVLSRSVSDAERTKMFARYGLVGASAAALGALASANPDLMASLGISQLTALRAMFVFYASLGAAAAVLYAQIPADMSLVTKTATSALGPIARDRLPDGGSVKHRLVC